MMKFYLGRNLFLTLCQEINWNCFFELRFTICYTVPNFSSYAYVAFAYTYFFFSLVYDVCDRSYFHCLSISSS